MIPLLDAAYSAAEAPLNSQRLALCESAASVV